MNRARSALAALLAVLVLLALLVTFAIELAGTQANNRSDIRTRVHQRAELAAALFDGLFGSVTQTAATRRREFGGPHIDRRALRPQPNSGTIYSAIVDQSGRILAGAGALTPARASAMLHDPAVTLVLSGHGTVNAYRLGNVLPGAGGGVMEFATRIATATGNRAMVSGFHLSALSFLLQADLREIKGVAGERNYVVDGNGVVLASTSPTAPVGSRFSGPPPPAARAALSRDRGGHYFDGARLSTASWWIVLDSPDGPLYASVSGLAQWLPWAIFAAFALVALVALALVRRVLSAVSDTRVANERLESVNRELEETNALLEQRALELARSNEELDQFASIASHDLQEPLRKVRTFTEELNRLEADNLSEKGADYLRRANAAAQRMQTLIEDLLKFSRVGTHAREFTQIDLEEVIRETLDDLSDVVESTGAVVHAATLPPVRGEPLQIRQLVQNLISNAIKFRRPEVTPEVWIEAGIEGSHVRLTVRDNGIGFEPRYADRIFGVFERLHGRSEYPGTGIGLALCRKIAERHGGSIAATGAPGAGATFTVTLPLASPPPAQVHPTRAPLAGSVHD